MKATNLLWSISLVVLGICTIILAGAGLLRMELPDWIVRCVGIMDLAALPVFAYATVKKLKGKQ